MNTGVTADISGSVKQMARRARTAAGQLRRLDSQVKDRALHAMAAAVREQGGAILQANQYDLEVGRRKGLDQPLLERLELTEKRIEAMASGLEEMAALRDPIGEIVAQWRRPGGLEVGQVRIPLGVIAVIYESRPNVTVEAAGLCFKAGNATILRGGSEAIQSNRILAAALRGALTQAGVIEDAVQLIETTDREAVGALLQLNDWIDVIIPRGGKSLIQRVVRESTIPVIKHYEGVCHVYVHQQADLNMAVDLAVNAKVQRPATCNAMETLLVDSAVAPAFLPAVVEQLKVYGVRILGCSETARHVAVDQEADEQAYRTEYLNLTCNLRVVDGIDEAIQHIATFGSRHTDAIVTRCLEAARKFVREVDSSSVLVNASTRLADGGVYGLGAEIGISTDKLHAFGPMGVRELTTKKFFVYGDGSLRT